MIKNIVFDIGNVLVDFGWKPFFEKFNLSDEEFNKLVEATVNSPAWQEYDRGVLSDEEVLNEFIKNAPELEEKMRAIFEDFNGLLKLFEYSRGWIIDLKRRGYKVYCLSNMSYKAVRECWDALKIIEEVDGYILSCDEKLIKPDPAIYERLFEKFNLKPSECIFIDDLPRNIEAANAAGMHGIVFTSVKEAEAQIQKISAEQPFESSYKKCQRIAALVAIVLIVLMYIVTLVLALIKAPWAKPMFKVCLGMTIALPIIAWGYIWIAGKLTHKRTIADFNFFEEK